MGEFSHRCNTRWVVDRSRALNGWASERSSRTARSLNTALFPIGIDPAHVGDGGWNPAHKDLKQATRRQGFERCICTVMAAMLSTAPVSPTTADSPVAGPGLFPTHENEPTDSTAELTQRVPMPLPQRRNRRCRPRCHQKSGREDTRRQWTGTRQMISANCQPAASGPGEGLVEDRPDRAVIVRLASI